MGLNCGCPAGASIATIIAEACSESLGQIQKLIFQRIYSSGTTKNFVDMSMTPEVPPIIGTGTAQDPEFPGVPSHITEDPELLATWAALKIALDGTKITISPFIEGPSNEPGGARKFGGGNATLGGIEKITGREPSKFSASIYSAKQLSTIKSMKSLQCENIGVFMVDEFGRIAGLAGKLSPDEVTYEEFLPIPIHSLFIGDKKLGGLEEPDGNSIEFSMMPNWSDNLYIVKPADFNPLTDL